MSKKPALGRGLGALLHPNTTPGAPLRPAPTGAAFGASSPPLSNPSAAVPASEETLVIGQMAGAIALIPISDIEANPDQPRRQFEEAALEELARSIKELGIIQPITVRRIRANRYQIISGERRFRASQLAGMDAVPVYIREADDQTLLEMALVENIQREDLHAIEIAVSLKRLMEECNLTQDALGSRIGKDRSTIANYIRLLKLPAEMQLAVSEKKISMGHARALLGIDSLAWQEEVFARILKEGLSVRQTESLASEGGKKASTSSPATVILGFNEQKVLADLQDRFGKKAALRPQAGGGGKIELRYDSAEDLDRILSLMDL
jgi:ParB family chromosome partitioning protein